MHMFMHSTSADDLSFFFFLIRSSSFRWKDRVGRADRRI